MPPFFRRRWVLWTAFIVWWLLLLLLSSLSSSKLPPGPVIPHFDKIMHFGYFFVGGSLLTSALFWSFARLGRWWRLGLVLLVITGIGWLDEWWQNHTPGRSGGDRGDWIADIAGGFSAALLFTYVLPRSRHGHLPNPGPARSA